MEENDQPKPTSNFSLQKTNSEKNSSVENEHSLLEERRDELEIDCKMSDSKQNIQLRRFKSYIIP